MSALNPFQMYSQKENTTTNNVLLMFSALYEIHPRYYEEYINSLIDENDFYKVVPSFKQQYNNKGNGIIDGYINVAPSTIIIETKLHGLEAVEKLLKYTESFQITENKILFHLSSTKYDEKVLKSIKEKIDSTHNLKGVNFFSLTYDNLVEQLGLLYKQYPYESMLSRLKENFGEYCIDEKLLISKKHILRAMASSQSYDLNIKYDFYFDLASRGYSSFKYLGIYNNKCVDHIGELENTVLANYTLANGLEVLGSDKPITPEQKSRLSNAIQESINQGWETIRQDHRFFLLKNLIKTNFKKISPGGIFRVRFFDLEVYCNKEELKSVETVAKVLSDKTWK